LDIAPSLELLLKNKLNFSFPEWTVFLGKGLDTNKYFNKIGPLSFICENKTYPDVIYDSYYLYKDSLFTVTDNFIQKSITNASFSKELNTIRGNLKLLNTTFPEKNKILPLEAFLKQYTFQIFPSNSERGLVKNAKYIEIEGKESAEEFNTLSEFEFNANDFGFLITSGKIKCTLKDNKEVKLSLVFEAQDSTNKTIFWINHDVDLKTNTSIETDLSKYYVLKNKNDFRKIRFLKIYIWNQEKALIKFDKIDFKAYIE